LLGDELDRHEQCGQLLQRVGRLLTAAAVLLQRFLGGFQLLSNRAEANASDFRIRTAIAFFFLAVGVVLFVVVLVICSRLCRCLRSGGFDFLLRAGGAVVVRVDIATEDVGQTAAFGGDALVVGENAVYGARKVG